MRLPPVALVDQSGRRWPLAELGRRRTVLVSFFFTGCTSICPPQTAALDELRGELARRSALDTEAGPLLLSISLDPTGDTPEAMRGYAERFGIALGLERGWLMLGGEPAALARVWSAFEVPGGGPDSHLAFFWIGRTSSRVWRRVSAFEPPERLAALLLEPSQ
ncbi:SCO family protein [Siccirubricoccus sp. G192]|uniref:SCO family protein n=1 Tax=Siccirubricoccus sp. G192 TaxID=2849651 RepID=UPI001C2C5990|nr:SCO family protein [Siccirubricoccus sp. G192]MBV1796531.1 SCO family protein [Siccirubricoccus sp. G192]